MDTSANAFNDYATKHGPGRPSWSRPGLSHRIQIDHYIGHSSQPNNGAEPHTIHADRWGAMVSRPVSERLVDLGILRSHFRPRTSNDNPYSEAQFTILKYLPDFSEPVPKVAWIRQPVQQAVPPAAGPTRAGPLSHDY
jgi:transposase InsO family protein